MSRAPDPVWSVLRFTGEILVPAVAARLNEKRSVPAGDGGSGKLVRGDLLFVPRQRLEHLALCPRAEPRVRALPADPGRLPPAGQVDNAVEQNDLLVVLSP